MTQDCANSVRFWQRDRNAEGNEEWDTQSLENLTNFRWICYIFVHFHEL